MGRRHLHTLPGQGADTDARRCRRTSIQVKRAAAVDTSDLDISLFWQTAITKMDSKVHVRHLQWQQHGKHLIASHLHGEVCHHLLGIAHSFCSSSWLCLPERQLSPVCSSGSYTGYKQTQLLVSCGTHPLQCCLVWAACVRREKKSLGIHHNWWHCLLCLYSKQM